MSDSPPPPPPPGPDLPPPPPSGGGPPGLEPVGTWPRFGARIIDYLVLFIPNILISLVIGGTGGNPFAAFGFRAFVATVITTLLSFGYFVYLEANRGQTVGKMALGCKVIGADGRLPTPEVSARRNVWMLLPIVPVIGGIAQFVLVIVIAVTINSDPFHRGWHDNFAGGTAVVRAT